MASMKGPSRRRGNGRPAPCLLLVEMPASMKGPSRRRGNILGPSKRNQILASMKGPSRRRGNACAALLFGNQSKASMPEGGAIPRLPQGWGKTSRASMKGPSRRRGNAQDADSGPFDPPLASMKGPSRRRGNFLAAPAS